MAGVHELILSLPSGYDTNIGAGGPGVIWRTTATNSLRRAFYMKPRIVVLDEPNSNLDAAGEKALAEAIEKARQAGATVIVVSHRPTLLASTDNIVVLNQGVVVKVGPRDQVLGELGGG